MMMMMVVMIVFVSFGLHDELDDLVAHVFTGH